MGNLLSEWLEVYFEEVTPFEFYRTIFPAGELEKEGEKVTGMYCGVAVEITARKNKNGKPYVIRHRFTDDLKMIDKLTETDNFCVCSPISYAGDRRTAENARFMYALAVDLDRIQIRDGLPTGLYSLWNGHIEGAERIPKPTFIVSSGTGLHLYYVLGKPIPLFQNVAKQLQHLKHDLTAKIWHGTIVDIHSEKEIQQEGIYQGFRMPGTITKNGDRARAFMTGEKVSIEYLNGFVNNGSGKFKYPEKRKITKARAKELYPEWYERRIEKGEPSGVWHINRALYDWWKREILEKATVGHRYWCLMTLAVYAYKCSMYDKKHNPNPVTYEELEKDCFEIMEYFETLTDDEKNHFNEADVQDALESFNSKWVKYPRETIEYRCGFALPRNKRNGRKQALHLELARGNKEILKKAGELKPEGRPPRPSKLLGVVLWQAKHPNGTKMECHRETGISRPTIDKYWNKADKEHMKLLV